MKNGDTLPDSVTWDRNGQPVQIVDRVFIERLAHETDLQEKIRIKRNLPAPTVSYVQGRLVR